MSGRGRPRRKRKATPRYEEALSQFLSSQMSGGCQGVAPPTTQADLQLPLPPTVQGLAQLQSQPQTSAIMSLIQPQLDDTSSQPSPLTQPSQPVQVPQAFGSAPSPAVQGVAPPPAQPHTTNIVPSLLPQLGNTSVIPTHNMHSTQPTPVSQAGGSAPPTSNEVVAELRHLAAVLASGQQSMLGEIQSSKDQVKELQSQQAEIWRCLAVPPPAATGPQAHQSQPPAFQSAPSDPHYWVPRQTS